MVWPYSLSETGEIESMELHHNPAQRDGGLLDVEKVWPSEHADIDPFRRTKDAAVTSFQRLFEQARRPWIEWNGHVLQALDRFPVLGARRLELTRVSTAGRWRQGASIRAETAARLRVNGVVAEHMTFWEDTAPSKVLIEVEGHPDTLCVYNKWELYPGMVHEWLNGAAMIVEELPNGRLYRCNDGEADEDFDDIVFKLERLPD